jgi:hypothetical protein
LLVVIANPDNTNTLDLPHSLLAAYHQSPGAQGG